MKRTAQVQEDGFICFLFIGYVFPYTVHLTEYYTMKFQKAELSVPLLKSFYHMPGKFENSKILKIPQTPDLLEKYFARS